MNKKKENINLEENSTNDENLSYNTQKSRYITILSKIYSRRVGRMWLTLSITLGVLFLAFLITTSIIMNQNDKTKNDSAIKNATLQNEYDSYATILKTKNYKYTEEMISKFFTEDQLHFITRKNWTYNLTVNNNTVKDDRVKLISPNVVVKFIEETTSNDLPPTINNKGTVTKGNKDVKFQDLVKIICSDKATKETNVKIENNKTIYTFIITDVPIGDIITVQLLDKELIEKTGIKSGYIEIFRPSDKEIEEIK
jgi:hypothetical protein